MENNSLINNTTFTIDSREVAEMLGKEHSDLLKEIEGRKDGKNVGIIPTLEKGNFHLSKYFIPSTYKSGTREYKCYEITKRGCELLGNKQQGERGILFTARYVERFNDMEDYIKNQEMEQLQTTITKFEKLTEEVRQYFKPLHKTKLEYNRLIKSLTSNTQEANLVKRWVFMKMGIKTWEDTCLDDSNRIKELIQSTSKLVQIDNFEQISLLQ